MTEGKIYTQKKEEKSSTFFFMISKMYKTLWQLIKSFCVVYKTIFLKISSEFIFCSTFQQYFHDWMLKSRINWM